MRKKEVNLYYFVELLLRDAAWPCCSVGRVVPAAASIENASTVVIIILIAVVWFISFTSILQLFLSVYLKYADYHLRLILTIVIVDVIISSNNIIGIS
jgi:hypothetical protein